jgi:hypothetical protein
MAKTARLVHPSAGELIDRLCIDQLKQLKRPASSTAITEEMGKIRNDLAEILRQRSEPLDASLVRLIVALAQVNLHIWEAKDRMTSRPSEFQVQMKLAHQINGIRNQLKNKITVRLGTVNAPMPSNTSRENLKGWRFSILDATVHK